MASFEEKINEGKQLGERLSKYGLELARNMPQRSSSSKTEFLLRIKELWQIPKLTFHKKALGKHHQKQRER